ncbi:MAG TPA: EAL domain-containing protein [Solirubrobacteraceae bacterium]|nr:EAL domain-containing protein [Solirubrobacteraceae bacterium]
MVTLSEILRWFLYRLTAVYNSVAVRAMRRDHLLVGSEKKFRALLESAPDAMVIVNSHGHITLANAQAGRMFGYAREELVGQSIRVLIPERLRERHRAHQRNYLHDAKTRPMGSDLELFGRRKDGTEFPVEISLSPLETDEGTLVSSVIRDITERKRGEALLRELADRDGLTGLLNRRKFEEHLSQEVALVDRYGGEAAMLLIDIDGLKDVNDTLGHACGDEMIKNVGAVIASRLRATDIVARVGGDEFALLLPRTTEAAARAVADGLLATIRSQDLVLSGHHLRPSVSIGVAAFEAGAVASDEVMVAADLGLYEAKDAGRNQVGVFKPPIISVPQSRERVSWSKRIRAGLDQGLLVPYRQPIVNLCDGSTNRYELLVRLLDERGEPTLPRAFLPTAERTGAVRDIDRRMISYAIELIAAAELARESVTYEVNISARSLGDPDLLTMISRSVLEAGIDPSSLVFEITETAAIANMEHVRRFAGTLRDLGCSFALDDFGAGFASFYYLKHVPLDWLKIDGDFVRDLPHNATDQLVVRHIAEMAHSLRLRTIAEFVEDARTLEMLTDYGVDCGQGNFVGEPEPIPDLISRRPAASARLS